MRHSLVAMFFIAFVATAATPVLADNSADITFWQTIQNSKNPAEYEAYLQAFPNGTFVPVAKLRIQELKVGAQTAAAPQAPAANAPANGAVVGDGTLSIEPAAPRVSQQITVRFANFPSLPVNDVIVIVAAGTPDTTPPAQALAKTPVDPYQIEHGLAMGSFAPGAYEARWLTSLYNNKQKLEVGARVAFTISR